MIKKEDVIDFLKKLNFEELLKDPKILKSVENKLFLYIEIEFNIPCFSLIVTYEIVVIA